MIMLCSLFLSFIQMTQIRLLVDVTALPFSLDFPFSWIHQGSQRVFSIEKVVCPIHELSQGGGVLLASSAMVLRGQIAPKRVVRVIFSS